MPTIKKAVKIIFLPGGPRSPHNPPLFLITLLGFTFWGVMGGTPPSFVTPFAIVFYSKKFTNPFINENLNSFKIYKKNK